MAKREEQEMINWEKDMIRYMSIVESKRVKQYNEEMTELEANLAKGTAKFGRN